jgi:hypothetical protein
MNKHKVKYIISSNYNTKHIIHNTYRKNHIDEPTTSSTSINWINGIEYHEVQLDENELDLGTDDCM